MAGSRIAPGPCHFFLSVWQAVTDIFSISDYRILSREIMQKSDKSGKKIITPKLKEIREYFSLNQSELAEFMGIGQNDFSRYENGIHEFYDELKIKLIDFIMSKYEKRININWFLTGSGEMFLSGHEKALEKTSEGYKVPLLRQKVSCGPGAEWQNEDNIVGYIDVFDQIPRLKIERLFALCVEGSSMLGTGIRNGDYVLFNAAKDQWPHDGIYVIALDGDVLCKRLEFDMGKTKIYSVRFADLDKAELVATIDNKDMSAVERLKIFGRVHYWIHPNLEE
jgi:SOS-response transcriptional repressor LexA